MATGRFGNNSSLTGWRRLSATEFTLAISVIVGLLFVSLRVMSMGGPAPHAAAAVASAPIATASAVVVGAEASSLAPGASETKNP